MPFTPFDAGKHAIRRAEFLLAAAGTKTPLPAHVRTDMRRMSVVMAVSALDTYMHRLVVDRAYTHDELPKALAKLNVPFEWLLSQADEAKAAARADPHNSRPRVGVKRQLRDCLLRVTFQRYEDVSDALAMAGKSKTWVAIGQELHPPLTPPEIRERLNAIVTRRNQIVHEGDYRRLERPQVASRNPITTSEARADIAFLLDLIEAIHSVVSSRA